MHPVTGRREDARTRGHAHAAPVIVHHDDLARAPQRGGQPVRMPAPHGRPRLQVQEQDIAPPVDGEPAPRVEGRAGAQAGLEVKRAPAAWDVDVGARWLPVRLVYEQQGQELGTGAACLVRGEVPNLEAEL
ncbi:hypothetical protein PG985_014902 [Apiospora marii]|uniref:uncharacterized protein n=1 Tax=Apiospora marii TaxID=335849 RepID=UPI00312FB3E2